MRLNRYLALCGLGSRRAVETLILAKRVAVNGAIAELGNGIGEKDRVEVDGKPVRPREEHAYFIFHKPPGCLCSRGDTHGRTTVYHLLPPEMRELHTVGRLDQNSRGLLFLTSDGALTQALTHPSREVLRVYLVDFAGKLSREELERLLRGVEVEVGVVFKCASVREEGSGYRLGLREGKKREIRRMLAAFGRRVVDLKRIAFGGVELGSLPEGAFRPLSQNELARLRSASVDSTVPGPSGGARRERGRRSGSRTPERV